MTPNPPISREFLNQLPGIAMVEFGAEWCGYCKAAQPSIHHFISHNPDIQHIKIEDGRGQRLGRTYAVKLWPTLIFLKDGVEVDRVVRPSNESDITQVLTKLK